MKEHSFYHITKMITEQSASQQTSVPPLRTLHFISYLKTVRKSLSRGARFTAEALSLSDLHMDYLYHT